MAQRIDKWLVYARFVKHRAKASEWVEQGQVRLNRERVAKCSQTVKPGDVLTFSQGTQVRVVRVLAEAERRGPANAARLLFEDLSLPAAPTGNDAEDNAPAKKPGATPDPLC